MKPPDKLYGKIAASFNKQAFMTLIGAELEHVEEGRVVISCKHRETLTQQQGLLHGGVVTSLADVACGYAALTTMPDDAEVLTVEFKINLLRPADTRKIIATGELLKSGKTLVVGESTVTDESGETIVAKMLATMIVSHPKRRMTGAV